MYFIDKMDCTGCSACYAVCPQKCIQMKKNNEGFIYPEIDETKCTLCNRCRKVCPVVNKIDGVVDIKKEEAYVVCHKVQSVRLDSASGGAFTMFAQYVLQQGGIICGAGYGNDLIVQHKVCDKYRELGGFRGSKYVQSEIGNIYEIIRTKLNEGKYVLFTGTPCQSEGLLNYLDKKYERLITVDIACHGVASPLLWEKYINDEEKNLKKKILYKKCRDKSRGWRQWGMVTKCSDGSMRDRVFYEDPYIEIYLSHNAMRYSCYRCKFRNIFDKRCDATMADCWGIEHFASEMDDDLGASILFLHSEKIKKLWTEISSYANVKKVNIYRALQGNIGAWGKNMKIPKVRECIYDDLYSTADIEELADKYRHISSKKEMIINKYPALYRKYAWLKYMTAPLRLGIVYLKMMKSD